MRSGAPPLKTTYLNPLLLSATKKETYINLSAYHFINLSGKLPSLQGKLKREWSELGIFGRIYIADEGINAQMSVPTKNFEAFERAVKYNQELTGLLSKFNFSVDQAKRGFSKLHVRIRKQIVAAGESMEPSLPEEVEELNSGRLLDALSWHDAMSKDHIMVDVRNSYESEIGHFEGALLPQVETFRESLPIIEKNVKWT